MFVPVLGFLFGCVAFAVIGGAVLALALRLQITVFNLVVFVTAALPGAAASAMVYGWVFGNEQGKLTSFPGVLGCLATLFMGGIASGVAAVLGVKCFRP